MSRGVAATTFVGRRGQTLPAQTVHSEVRPTLQYRPVSSDSAGRELVSSINELHSDYGLNTYSGGNNLSSSMFPRNPNRVLICSEVVLGETFVT